MKDMLFIYQFKMSDGKWCAPRGYLAFGKKDIERCRKIPLENPTFYCIKEVDVSKAKGEIKIYDYIKLEEILK